MRKSVAFCICLCVGHLAALAQPPAGYVALYPLNNSAADISGNGYNGALVSTSNDINRFGASNSATAFVAGTSTGSFPSGLVAALADDFTVGFWVKTTMSAPTSTQWYGGSALIDAEVCGGTSDWGTALINGGQIAFGIGNPDMTIISPLSYNDGTWHFVTATRAEAAGTITLYIDGSQVATTSGVSTAPRTAPPQIGLGDNNCVAAGVFTGSLDDVIAYNSTLNATQVATLYSYYSSVALPIRWESFTGQVVAGQSHLEWTTADASGYSSFEIDRSTGGGGFSRIGEMTAGQGTAAADGSTAYSFIDSSPANGSNFYRVEAIAADGSGSWTSILELTVNGSPAGLRLQSNPVTDQLTLVNSGGITINRLQVIDVAGRVVLDKATQSGNSLIQLNVSGLKAGYYFLRVGEPDQRVTLSFLKL